MIPNFSVRNVLQPNQNEREVTPIKNDSKTISAPLPF